MSKVTDLAEMLRKQERVQESLGHPMRNSNGSIKENVLALIVEATEVLNEINWKAWSTKPLKEIDRSKLTGEIADCFLFWMNLVNESEISASEILEVINTKQNLTINRYGIK